MRIPVILCLAAIVLATVLSAVAQSPARGGSPIARCLDLNGDGAFDASELEKAPASLKSLDANHDGQLTSEEFRPNARAPRSAPPDQAVPVPAPSPAPVQTSGPAVFNNNPNLLILIADDLGWNGVGFHDSKAPTPCLDKLAGESTELTRFLTYPLCSPTRAAFLTGQLSRRFGIVDALTPRDTGLPAGTPTLATVCRAAGYSTALAGKWHLGNNSPPSAHGFGSFYGFLGGSIDYYKHTNFRNETDWQRDGKTLAEEGYSTDLIAAETIRLIEKRDPYKPFLVVASFNAPHPVHAAPAELVAKHGSGADATYLATIEAFDAAVGRVLAALDREHLRENTLVLFFSDNGGGLRFTDNRPFREGKDSIHEGGIRTPCLVRWPGKTRPNETCAQPVSVHDLLPTLAEAVGLPKPEKTDGSSQWGAITSAKTLPRDPVLIATRDFALIQGDWKLIESANGSRSLYNLANDPGESRDEFQTQTAVAADLTKKLADLKQTLPPAPAPRAKPGPR